MNYKMDYNRAEREKWHENCCPRFCSYAEWVSLGRVGVYTRPKNKNDGHFHIIDNLRYISWNIVFFKELSVEKIKARSRKHLNQNINESLHQRHFMQQA